MSKIIVGQTYNNDGLTQGYVAPPTPTIVHTANNKKIGHSGPFRGMYESDGLTLNWPNNY